MSGPIIRKYGFPNFESIFGDRPLQHGGEEEAPATAEEAPKAKAKAEKPASEAKKKISKKK